MGLVQVATNTVTSAVSSVVLTGIDDDSVYMVACSNVKSVNDNVNPFLRFTVSGTGDSSANYDYAQKTLRADSSFGNDATTNDNEINLDNIGTGTGEQFNCILNLFNFNNASEYSFITMENDSSFKYDEDNKITQPAHKIHMGPEQKRRAALQLLEYNTVELVLSCRTDISVGQIIQLDIPPAVPGEDVEPKFFNGPHLLTKIMWRLTPKSCELHATAVKDSVNNQIETVKIEYGGTE